MLPNCFRIASKLLPKSFRSVCDFCLPVDNPPCPRSSSSLDCKCPFLLPRPHRCGNVRACIFIVLSTFLSQSSESLPETHYFYPYSHLFLMFCRLCRPTIWMVPHPLYQIERVLLLVRRLELLRTRETIWQVGVSVFSRLFYASIQVIPTTVIDIDYLSWICSFIHCRARIDPFSWSKKMIQILHGYAS